MPGYNQLTLFANSADMKFPTSIVVLAYLALGFASAQEYRVSTLVSGMLPVGPLPPLEVRIGHVSGVATDRSGNVYFSSQLGCVFKIDLQKTLWRVAGTCQHGDSGDGGPAISAQLTQPAGLAVDSTGNLYVADAWACRVRKVTADGIISTIAGTGICGPPISDGGPTSLSGPNSIAVDQAGDVFIAERNGIRKLSSGGGLTSVVANVSASALALDSSGNLYIAAGTEILKLAGGQVTTLAGNLKVFSDSGDGGPAIDATFGTITGLTIDSAGDVLVADGLIRSISPAGIVHIMYANACCSVPNAYASEVGGTALDLFGNLYIGFILGDEVLRIDPNGVITDFAGTTNPTYIGDNGPAIDAQLFVPEAVAVDATGNLYIADFGNSRVRKISNGVVTTVAGNGTAGFSGDGGPAISAQIAGPDGLAVDSDGNLYIAEYLNDRVRKVTPDGIITTVAGSDHCCDYGDGGLATDAFVPLPHGIAVDKAGNLYIAEWPDSRIRKVTPSGIISTYAGNGTLSGFSGDGGPAIDATLSLPWGLAADGYGNLFIADTGNLRLRKIASDGTITTIPGAPSSFFRARAIAVDSEGNIFTSSGEIISSSGTQSSIRGLFSGISGNYPVFLTGVGIAVDGSGNLFILQNTDVLELNPIRMRPIR